MKMRIFQHVFFGYFAPLHAIYRAIKNRKNPLRLYVAIMHCLDKKYSTIH